MAERWEAEAELDPRGDPRRAARLHGGVRQAAGKQELEWPPSGYPSSRTVRRHFGSFTAGLRATGPKPRESDGA